MDPVTRTVERMIGQLDDFFADAFVALAINKITGDYAEFGSYGGQTLRLAHKAMEQSPTNMARHIWAFDSFDVLPDPEHPRDERWSHEGPPMGQHGVEQFHEAVARFDVPREAYTTVEGYYDQSLPAIGDGEPRDIALAYVDCNMYSSTVSVMEFLAPRLKHGMIVAFDDYYNYSPDHLSGERAALHEFLVDHPEWHFQFYRPITYTGVAFIVERADLLKAPVSAH